jgi:hypothetical protein
MRETRSYGSVRGVRSNPYPYRDIQHPDAEGGALPVLQGNGLDLSASVADAPDAVEDCS